MNEVFGLTIFILVCSVAIYLIATLGSGAITGVKKKEQKVLNVIVSSGITAVSDISKSTKIKEGKLIPMIQSLITHANEEFSLYNGIELLRGARLDLNKMEIIMPIKKEPWTCVYCRASNEKDVLTCSSCQAPKKKV